MANTPWMKQTDIERLMSREPTFHIRADAAAADSAEFDPSPALAEPTMALDAAEELLRQAEMAVRSMHSRPDDALPDGLAPFQLEELQGGTVAAEAANLDLIRDVELSLKIELGRTEMSLDDVLKLRKGSVVPLDRQAGEPVDVYANGRLIARGEVLVLDDNFCVRVVELTAGIKDAA